MSGVASDHASSRRWSSHIWLLILVGLAAVIGGYWLPSRLVSGDRVPTPAQPPPQLALPEQGTTNLSKPDHRAASGNSTDTTIAPNRLRVASPQAGSDCCDLYGALWRLAFATAAVLALAVVFVWLARRFLARRAVTPTSIQPLQILGEMHLGARCRLLLIRIGQEQALVGLDGRGVSALLLVSPQFSELFDQATLANTEPRKRHQGAILAAMVGEEDGAHGS